MQSITQRLEKIRTQNNWTWAQVGQEIELSISALMMARRGERNLSPRAMHRLEEAEKRTGIAAPTDKMRELFSTSGEIADTSPGSDADRQAAFERSIADPVIKALAAMRADLSAGMKALNARLAAIEARLPPSELKQTSNESK